MIQDESLQCMKLIHGILVNKILVILLSKWRVCQLFISKGWRYAPG